MKKIFSKLHLWLSLPFGIVIALICFTGSLLVFQNEILEMANPQLYEVEKVGEKPLSSVELMSRAQAQLPDSVTVTGFQIYPDADHTYQLKTRGTPDTYMLDPYSGKITGKKEKSGFFSAVVGLHGHLLDSPEKDGIFWGKIIVGVSTLVMVLILVTGLVIWIPHSIKALKHRLQIKVKSGWLHFFLDLHISGGFYASLFLLAMALTGLTWSFKWYSDAFYTVFGEEEEPMKTVPHKTPKQNGENFTQWDNVIAQMQEKYEDFNDMTLQKNSITVAYGNNNRRDTYTFDSATGQIVDAKLYEDQPYNNKVRSWVWAIHTGKWGGMTTRILHCMAAFVGGILCLTGYYFWFKKKRAKHHHRHCNAHPTKG